MTPRTRAREPDTSGHTYALKREHTRVRKYSRWEKCRAVAFVTCNPATPRPRFLPISACRIEGFGRPLDSAHSLHKIGAAVVLSRGGCCGCAYLVAKSIRQNYKLDAENSVADRAPCDVWQFATSS